MADQENATIYLNEYNRKTITYAAICNTRDSVFPGERIFFYS